MSPPIRLRQPLLSRLLEEITRGRYPAGSRLPSEPELAQTLGVSRGVVRELLRALEDRGVISVRQGRGSVVRPAAEWNLLDQDVLVAMLPTPASIGVLTHYLECRRILETEASALAAQRATSQDFSAIADALARMSDLAAASQTDAELDRRFHEADIAFHSAVFHAARNPVLGRVAQPMQRAMTNLRPRLALHPEERLRKTIPEHKAILGAIADRDPERARNAMTDHLATIESYLREYRLTMST